MDKLLDTAGQAKTQSLDTLIKLVPLLAEYSGHTNALASQSDEAGRLVPVTDAALASDLPDAMEFLPDHGESLNLVPQSADEVTANADQRVFAERNLKFIFRFRAALPVGLCVAAWCMLSVPWSRPDSHPIGPTDTSDVKTLPDPVTEAAVVSPPVVTNDSPVPSLGDPETLLGSEVTVPASVASSGDLPTHDQGLAAADTLVERPASVDGQAIVDSKTLVDGQAFDDGQVIDGPGGPSGASVNWPNDSAALDPPATEGQTNRDLAVNPSIVVRDDWAEVFSSIGTVDPDAMLGAIGNSVPATTETTAEAWNQASSESSNEAKPSDGDELNEVSPQRALPSVRIVFVNPTENRGPVRFLIGKRSLELLPGERFEVADGSPERPPSDDGPRWNVKFHRGGKYGEFDSVLTAGEYVFHVSPERGWELSPGSGSTKPPFTTPPKLSVSAGDLSAGELGTDDFSVKKTN